MSSGARCAAAIMPQRDELLTYLQFKHLLVGAQ